MRFALPLALAALAFAGCVVDPDGGKLPDAATLVKRYGSVAPGTFLFGESGEDGRQAGAAVFTEVPRERTPGYRQVDVSLRTTADAAGPAGEVATISIIFRPAGSTGAETIEGYVSFGRFDSEGDVRLVVRRDEPGRIDAVFAAVLRGGGGEFLPTPRGRQRVEGGFSAVPLPRADAGARRGG